MSTICRVGVIGFGIMVGLSLATTIRAAESEEGFVSLFDGKTLDGWKLIGKHGRGYSVRDGMIICEAGGGGKLMTVKEYPDFIFRFEFKLKPGSNNGIGIRAPYEGDAAYNGMEIQVLDDTASKYEHLEPGQYHGSIYKVVAAKRGALKPVGEWNNEQIECVGRHVKVTVNGQVTVDANLDDVKDPAILKAHPGLKRTSGHIGFLGHNDYVEFRNIRIKEVKPERAKGNPGAEGNAAPEGFTAMFNGKDLTGWKGLIDPAMKAKLKIKTEEDLKKAQSKADEKMRQDWQVQDGMLVYTGSSFDNLCSAKDYKDFELLIDWKINPESDSGIYLRGNPQVQIWDNSKAGGSGGLFNNKTNPSKPLKVADKPVGQWNHFRIIMKGDKATVYLNDQLVVDNIVLENYWEKGKPLPVLGTIELQAHKSKVYFKNIYVRELGEK